MALRKGFVFYVLVVSVLAATVVPAAAYEFWWPTSGWVSSLWGPRGDGYHAGIDIAANSGSPIYAACKGTIVFRGWYSGYGNCIDIQHEGNWVTRYAHQSGFASGLGVGSWVNRGQLIGYIGSTGNSTGPHLHFEIRQGVTFSYSSSYQVPGYLYQDITAKTEIPRTYSNCTCSSAPTYAATYRAQSFPANMVAGSTEIAWVEFNNTGTGQWTHDDTRLGTSSPADRSSPFCNTPNWPGCNRPTDVDQSSVTNGQAGRFTFILKAPATPGTYTEKYRLVQEGVAWFGPEITWTINVTAAKGNLTGTVRNASNNAAVAGATVALAGGPSTTTNSSGVYSFNSINAGSYTATVSATGFNSASSSVTVSAGATATKDFSLTPTDTQAPTAPSGLAATPVSPSQINLTWNASTDNVGVTGYVIYRGSAEIGTATGTSYSDNGLPANTAQSYTVKARDAANNRSGNSNTATATTFPGSVPIFEDGFANLNYWEALVQSPMTGPNPMELVGEKNHLIFNGTNTIRSVSNGTGTLIGHRFVPAFAQAKFETWFFDGAGASYAANFTGTTDGWVTTTQGGNAAYDTMVNVDGTLRGGSANDTTIAGWTSGCHKDITSGFAAGEAYNFSMSAKWPAAPAGKSWTTAPRLFAQFLDSGGGVIRTDYSGNIATDNAWHGYSVSGTVPVNTTKIRIGQWGYVNATMTPLYYYADNVSFTTNEGAAVNNNSRQGLQVRCLTPDDGLRALYMVGCYSVGGDANAPKNYSVGYYKVCGTGCTNWYWTYNVKPRTAGWHKLTLDFLPYSGSGDVKAYIDGTLVATLDRTLDTQMYGLNMVGYGFHYGVNYPAWYDDVAMYANQPHPGPTAGTPQPLSPSSIRWNFTDNSNNEIGFKVQDPNNVIMGVTGALTATGSGGSIVEEGLQPNTQYTRVIRAYNGSLDSFASAVVSARTLPAQAGEGQIVCDRTVGTWYGSSAFTFTPVGGFGEGTVAGYRYAWTQTPAYTFGGSEPVWNSGNLVTSASAEGSWYLHVQGLNSDGVAGGSFDMGPYNFDGTPPSNPTAAAETGGAANGVWQSAVSDPAFTWTGSADALSGIGGYAVYFGPADDGTSETVVTSAAYDPPAVAAGVNYLRVCAIDGAGNRSPEWVTLFTFKYDDSGADTPVVSDDGDYTGSRTRLNGYWFNADPDSEITEYKYAVGTAPGADGTVAWTSAGTATSAVIEVPSPGLADETVYYISVKARNEAGDWSEPGSSNGIRVAPESPTIGAAKMLADGSPVALVNKPVTADLGGAYYIEEADWSSGILVLGPGAAPGSRVTVGGVMGANEFGERAVTGAATVVEQAPSMPAAPTPLMILGRNLGNENLNSYTNGITGGFGLNTVGLLVKLIGRVEAVQEGVFWLNDGSTASPIKVAAYTSDLSSLAAGDLVAVVGVASLEAADAVRTPVVQVPTQQGIQKLTSP